MRTASFLRRDAIACSRPVADISDRANVIAMSSTGEHVFHLVNPGPRPPFPMVAEHLWGPDCDFDSDGDSVQPDVRDWTELTLTLRPAYDQRVDVDPVEGEMNLTLQIRSTDGSLAEKAAEFLAAYSGGMLSKAGG